MQYLRILFNSFGEEDFQRFCIKLSMFKLFLAIISPIMQVAPPFEDFLIGHTQEYLRISMQYLRILFSSFGEEDFQRFALN